MKKFKVEIELGNAEMHSRKHIIKALKEVIQELDNSKTTNKLIKDINGNEVGNWRIIRTKHKPTSPIKNVKLVVPNSYDIDLECEF